jgi:[ribosomal protein S5]-alanine N-acetyltransferase
MKTMPQSGFKLFPITSDGTAAPFGPPWPHGLAHMIEMTRAFYAETGYAPPWIGYLATQDGEPVGGGAFVGVPTDKAVEIAYFTLPDRQGHGFATSTARALIDIARVQDKDILIRAKTLCQPNASTRILERLGFDRAGLAQDHEIGDAWLWIQSP